MAKQVAEIVQEKPVELTLEQLKAKVAEAIASGDDTTFMTAVATIAKRKAEVAKAQAETARKEAEALAGQREAESKNIMQLLRSSPSFGAIVKAVKAVKAHGFTFLLDELTPEEIAAGGTGTIKRKDVRLLIPTIKSRKTGGGGGGATGKSKAEYGMSLGEIFDKFATAEDKAKLAEATTNSSQWQVKVAVKKRAIDAGELKPIA